MSTRSVVQEESLQAFMQDACLRLANIMRDAIVNEISRRLTSWNPPNAVLAQHPYMADIRDFVTRYSECFVVQIDMATKDVLLGVSAQLLAQNNFPSELPTWLEYGYESLPPTPHLRPAMAKAEYFAREIAKELQQWM